MLEMITLWCRKQTHKRQKILTRQFSLNQEGASMCSLLLSNTTLWCRKQTHKRQKILTRQFSLNQEGASMCSLPLSNTQAQNGWQWLLLISLMQLYLPLTWDLSRSKVHNLSWLAKRLGGWVRACSLAGNGVVQESRRRSKDPLNMQVP
jgi:hypothetical protein